MTSKDGALSMLQSYDSSSDSERDSGYTSEDDKKRKHDSLLEEEFKSKRRRPNPSGEDESMEIESELNAKKNSVKLRSSNNVDETYCRNSRWVLLILYYLF